jgi:multidrug efflux system membrane fusion protein
MRAAGTRQHGRFARLTALSIIGCGAAAGLYALYQSASLRTTDDAAIDADVVHVAAAVGGRIVDIAVTENMQVEKGDLLFQIDPAPFRLAVAQAEADLEIAEATLDTRRRVVSTQRSAAAIAADQVHRAAEDLDLASRTVERLRPLAGNGYVPRQRLDQAETTQRDAESALQQAQEQEEATVRAIDTEAGAQATVRARKAALAIAERALDDTTVRAPHAGRVVGLNVSSGEMVAPSQAVFTLVDSEEWFAVGKFREFDLAAIAIGDCATVYSMIDRRLRIKGVVQGIGSGVLDQEHVELPRSVP